MAIQVQVVFVLTFIIHLVSMLSYSIRIAGVRTGRIAVSLTFFNVLLLVSRTSNTFQDRCSPNTLSRIFLTEPGWASRLIFAGCCWRRRSLRLCGFGTNPTFQRMFSRAIEALGSYRSMLRVMLRIFSFQPLVRREIPLKCRQEKHHAA